MNKYLNKIIQDHSIDGNAAAMAERLSQAPLMESSAIKCLPQGTYYQGVTPEKGPEILVCITKDHPTDRVSFMLSNINGDTGNISSSMFEIAVPRLLFGEVLKTFDLKPMEDKKALERLVYDAEAHHLKMDYQLHPEFLPGLQLLSHSRMQVKKANLLAPFQRGEGKASTPPLFTIYPSIEVPDSLKEYMEDKYEKVDFGDFVYPKWIFEDLKAIDNNGAVNAKKGNILHNLRNKAAALGKKGKAKVRKAKEPLSGTAPAGKEADLLKSNTKPQAANEVREEPFLMAPSSEIQKELLDLIQQYTSDDSNGNNAPGISAEAANENHQAKATGQVPGQAQNPPGDNLEGPMDLMNLLSKALKIMSGDETIDPTQNDPLSKDPFETEAEEPYQEESSPYFKVLDQMDLLYYPETPIYDPNYCKDWNLEDWSAFIDQDHSTYTIKSLLLPEQFQPLLYLLKNSWIYEIESDNEYLNELNFLANHPVLLHQGTNFKEWYQPSQYEILLQAQSQLAFSKEKSSTKKWEVCKRFEQQAKKFPDNPYFGSKLHEYYLKLDEQQAFRQSCRLYNSSKNRETAVSIYFGEICKHNKANLIKEFLGKSILFENHLPKILSPYNESAYQNYYIRLAIYFGENNKWVEFLTLLDLFLSSKHTQQDPSLFKIWNSIYYQAIDFMKETLNFIKEETSIKGILLDNLRNPPNNNNY